ncbi:MAG: response regulator [Pseudomonadota bacterium]
MGQVNQTVFSGDRTETLSRVLIMDDDTPQAMELGAQLRECGHEVVLAYSTEQARDALWHWDFDVLITDIVVRRDGRPVSDSGLSLISWVRQQTMITPGLRKLPIVAISGSQAELGMDFLLPTANRIGADVVLEKPLDIKHLDGVVQKLSADT